ncbi:MAG: LytTR family transcriptional regulator DNA-binding domain-containing protein [Bacteroidales bacterium]|nr:LytTR family transcriptional regulator DNA-binding domain-containing protein [Bacteroidales bacterium]
MLKFLNKSYPFNDDLRHNAKIILFISLGVLAFLLIFQPIDIVVFTTKEIIYLVLGLAISTFLVLSVNLIVLPSLFPKIFYNNIWSIKREIIWNLWILLTISSCDLLFYTQLFDVIEISFSDIGKIILLGFLPVAVLIIINQERLLRSHLKSAQQLNKKLLESIQQKEKLIHFESDYKKDKLSISPNSLLVIKSADNYIEVYYKSEGVVKKQMIRSSLKKALETVNELDYILRCHRTFIVNTNHIKEIEGNSQGYKLYFEMLHFPVLVSQKYIKSFKETI